jgi:type I restriction enzyme S subunit
LQYLLLSSTYLQELTRISKWQPPSQFDIGWEQLKLLPIVTPNLERQKAIADYLDRETTRIDALIEKKRRLIHLVSSRTSQFVGSVCSGTNAADFEHWNRVPLKSLFSFSKGKDAQRLSGEFVGNHQGPYPVYSGQTAGDAIFGQIDTFDFDLPDGAILVATVGAEAMSCRIISGRFSLSQNCALMIPRSGTNVFLPFIVGQLRDLFLEKRSEIPDHMQPSLRIEDLNRFYVQIPSLETQESIASLVDIKWSKTGVLLKSLDSQVEKLLERRSSIVTAAVTGDLEIPEVAA